MLVHCWLLEELEEEVHVWSTRSLAGVCLSHRQFQRGQTPLYFGGHMVRKEGLLLEGCCFSKLLRSHSHSLNLPPYLCLSMLLLCHLEGELAGGCYNLEGGLEDVTAMLQHPLFSPIAEWKLPHSICRDFTRSKSFKPNSISRKR